MFISHVLIRDLTIITGFIEATLLPLTPVYVITILVIACSLYISWAGIEVIARYNEICFLIFLGVVLFIPISLINSLAIENFEPVLGLETIPSVFQSAYLGLAWVGEIIIVFLIIGMVNPLKNVKKAIFLGGAIGIGMLFILIFSGIAVLGAEILRYTTYPTYTLVQQIRITEFLDRLDFFLVSLYFPAVFSKFALFFFGLQRAFNLFSGMNTKYTFIPLSIMIGVLANVLFENKGEKLEFQIHTWATMGLVIELMIVIVMIFVIRSMNQRKPAEKNA